MAKMKHALSGQQQGVVSKTAVLQNERHFCHTSVPPKEKGVDRCHPHPSPDSLIQAEESPVRYYLGLVGTRDPDASGYGIYGVFWYGKHRQGIIPKHPKDAAPKTALELEGMLNGVIRTEQRSKLRAVVIDVSVPNGQSVGSRKRKARKSSAKKGKPKGAKARKTKKSTKPKAAAKRSRKSSAAAKSSSRKTKKLRVRPTRTTNERGLVELVKAEIGDERQFIGVHRSRDHL